MSAQATPTSSLSARLSRLSLPGVALCALVALLSGCGERDDEVRGPDTVALDAAAKGDGGCVGEGCACAGRVDGAPCDDGDDCTSGDACKAGVCAGVPACACRLDSDCALDDLCLGKRYCDLSVPGHACATVPGTAVICEAVAPCASAACAPASGQCVQTPLPEGTPCDDGDACTADACDGHGGCAPGPSTCECQTTADCESAQSPDLCAPRLFCDHSGGKGVCAVNPATAVSCPKPTAPCTAYACQPATGNCPLVELPAGTACDDGVDCTVGDVCGAGGCVAGTSTCPCQSDDDCAASDDGDLCNGVDYCDLSAGGVCKPNPATVVTCSKDADTACSAASCQPKTGSCKLVAALDGAACDDGSACTAGEHCSGGVCTGGVKSCACQSDADCGAHEDGDLCNGTLYCDPQAGACVVNPATVVTCPSAPDPGCSTATCTPATGVCVTKVAPDGKACNDGSPCTLGDACKGGSCVAGPALVCPCSDDAQCAKFEDGNTCNGTLFCDKSGPKPQCTVNPATIVQCPQADASSCALYACDAKLGACAKLPLADGESCDDSDPCTSNDGCSAGVCAGLALDCDDGDACTDDLCAAKLGGCAHKAKACADDNACTADACDGQTGVCTHSAVVGPCDDGDACTTADHCESAACVGAKLACGDGNACTADTCSGGACAHIALTATATAPAPCSDGDACTAADACEAGACVGLPLAATACADADACTFDLCHAKVGCLHLLAVGAGCDDGDPCTAGDACAGGGCVGLPAPATACDDDNVCTSDGCKPGVGCTHAPLSGPCDDGDPCTSDDACSGGSCEGGGQLGCQCTADSDCAVVEDGNLCNGTLRCDKSAAPFKCVVDAATIVDCGTGDGSCATSACVPQTGACQVSKAPDGAACAPGGDHCVSGSCADGVCKALGAKSCDDGEACTFDACKASVGCLHDGGPLAGKPCDDGDPCTKGAICKAGSCVGGVPLGCDDGNTCTLDLCDGASGCVHLADVLDGIPCEDGDGCTNGELCAGSACAGAVAKVCDDGNPCTKDSCASASQGGVLVGVCSSAAVTGPCDDGDVCTAKDACSAGVCTGAKLGCNDGNPCTVDACVPNKGCVHDAAKLEGKLCVHPSGCVVGAICQAGTCSGGDASGCGNVGDCSVQSDALYVATGAAVSGANVRFADDGSAWALSAIGSPPLWVASRTDAFGDPLASVKITMDGKATTAAGNQPLADGGVLLGGGSNPESAYAWQKWKTRLRRVDAKGAIVWADKQGVYSGIVYAIAARADGTFVHLAQPDPNIDTRLVAFKGDGTQLWNKVYKGPGSTYYLNGLSLTRVVELDGGDIVATGRLSSPSSDSSVGGMWALLRVSSTGAQKWQTYIKVGYEGGPGDAVEMADGSLAIVGHARATTATVYKARYARVSSTGKLLANVDVPHEGPNEVVYTAARDGDDLMVVGRRPKPGSTDTFATFGRLGPDIKWRWQRGFDVKTVSYLTTVRAAPGGWWLGGTAAVKSNGGYVNASLLIRTGPFGHSPCAAAGKCLKETAKSCDDGDECTYDGCEADVGCVHSAIAGCK